MNINDLPIPKPEVRAVATVRKADGTVKKDKPNQAQTKEG